MHPAFAHVRTWVFDLDETLYPPAAPLFPQIEARMERWIVDLLGVTQAEAARLRRSWWERHGTTLAGLMREHGIDPHPFLADVHDIDFGALRPDPALAEVLAALPGRRIVHTNGTAAYARRVLEARGLADGWDAVHGVEEAGLHPKPDRAAFEAVWALDGLDPRAAAMFEDSARNLLVPHESGMATVHVAPARAEGDHVHHHAPDLAAFLRRIAGA
ncbi:pyrimidine 5'-nucleotidase [Jannaschia sp. W003]|uniref:pyrimidine 5'-nucleotidase n=1 Tax=Jannaschia sp. W003 TaxID=2867012 RepID=UPI0021A6AB28|nr:pyrimidine 5'-nucleotidase [Jannaschia sp. W003]UWQ21082.1 pyrimidine 5'-nucleotidase [Jannaschia sp. W003]